jgi:hypothetical protein
MKYENKYGSLRLELVTDYVPVSQIRAKDQNWDVFIDLDTAEKVALITGNKDTQLCVGADKRSMFIIHHIKGDTAAVCKVVDLNFDNKYNATKELINPNPSIYLGY